MKKKIITHGDVDGIASGSILLKRFPESDVQFSEPYKLQDDLARWKDKLALYDDIMLSDLSVSPRLVPILSEISKKSSITIIDHHPDTIKVAEQDHHLPNTIFITPNVNEKMSASQVVQRAFGTEETENVSLLGAVGDNIVRNPVLETITDDLAHAIGLDPKDDDFRLFVLSKLDDVVKGKKVPEIVERANENKQVFNELFEISSRVQEEISDKDLILADLSKESKAVGRVGKIADEMQKRSKKSSMVLFSPEPEKIVATVRAINDKLFDEVIKSCKEVGGTGGGHKRAFSCTINEKQKQRFVKNLSKKSK